ncbi:MAG: hypothetical protein ACR2IE_20475 [Candidatus Sumerlaeaceae bacterium]
MGKIVLVAVLLIVLFVTTVVFIMAMRRRRGIAGAGLICVTPQEFTLSSPIVKSAAERAFTGEPQFHPIVTTQDESGSVLIEAGEHPFHVGRTVAEDDQDRYGLALHYAAGTSSLDANEAYIALGKLAFELMPAGATRLIAPHMGRESRLTEEMKQSMKAGDFFYGGTFYGEPWLVHVDGDSREMKAAVEQARKRWPEFVEAKACHAW